jgi:hypothetical protein
MYKGTLQRSLDMSMVKRTQHTAVLITPFLASVNEDMFVYACTAYKAHAVFNGGGFPMRSEGGW